jgi:TonB family protein
MGDLGNDIEKYLRGELSPTERHALEKRALSDPFLADALEGGESISMEDFSGDLKFLRQNLDNRLDQDDKKVVSLWSWTMRIAAGLLILVAATFAVFQLTDNNQDLPKIADSESPGKNTPPATQETADNTAQAVDSVEAIKEITTHDASSTLPEASKPSVSGEGAKPAKADGYIALNNPAKKEEQKRAEEENKLSVTLSEPSSQPSPIAGAPVEQEALHDSDVATDSTVTIAAANEKRDRVEAAQALQGKVAGVEAEEQKRAEAKRKLSTADKSAGAPAASESIVAREFGAGHTAVIKGKVTAADDGTGLPGVNVLIKGTEIGTITDAEGNYEIPVEKSVSGLVFTFIGMENQEVSIGEATEVNVAMNPDMTELSEVVVVGYTQDPKDDIIGRITFATPAGGRAGFKKYIETNLHYPEQALENNVEGKVTVQFTVEATGGLTNFKVVKGIGHGCDEEVIRLITQGPKWNPTRKDDEPIVGRMKVRVRFRLPKK